MVIIQCDIYTFVDDGVVSGLYKSTNRKKKEKEFSAINKADFVILSTDHHYGCQC